MFSFINCIRKLLYSVVLQLEEHLYYTQMLRIKKKHHFSSKLYTCKYYVRYSQFENYLVCIYYVF